MNTTDVSSPTNLDSSHKFSRRERSVSAIPGDVALPAKKGSKDRTLRADVFRTLASRAKKDTVHALWLPWRSGLLAEGNIFRHDLLQIRSHSRPRRNNVAAAFAVVT